MSLTIEEIQHYPIGPGGLECKRPELRIPMTVYGVYYFEGGQSICDFLDGTKSFIRDVKPILYPLDLTKPITIKGETFTPMKRIYQLWLDVEGRRAFEYTDHKEDTVFNNIFFLGVEITELPYWAVDQLRKWFIDVNSLIPQGKAISVHELDKNCYE